LWSHYTWILWSNCGVACGGHSRRRDLRCPGNVTPQTLENCLKYCNITEIWWWRNSYEQGTCETSCIQRLDMHTYYQCKCSLDNSSYSCKRGETFFLIYYLNLYGVLVYTIDGWGNQPSLIELIIHRKIFCVMKMKY
jgi:hypothetical protein